jgi:hypothetical protein
MSSAPSLRMDSGHPAVAPNKQRFPELQILDPSLVEITEDAAQLRASFELPRANNPTAEPAMELTNHGNANDPKAGSGQIAQQERTSLILMIKVMWSVFWSSLVHPTRTTVIDPHSGKIVGHYR